MKKITLGILVLLAFTFSAKATHLMGGEIVVSIDSNNLGTFTLTLYRDNNPGTASLPTTIQLATVVPVSLSLIQLDTLNSLYPVERYVYQGTAQVNSYGKYFASFSLCCRNAAIQNVSGTPNFFIATEFTNSLSTANSTPVFLNEPVVTFPLDTLWSYNPLPFDADGDSLHWTIDTPVVAFGNYVGGYSSPPGNPNGPLSMNSQTGEITWSPSQIGNYAISILVEEYRNGIQIGEIRRDMQLIVVPDTASMNLITPSAPQNAVTTGQAVNLNFQVQSVNPHAALGLSAIGDPFELTNSNANFTVSGSGTSTLSGTFTWTPAASDARDRPYRVVVRATDGKFSYDYTLLISVAANNVSLEGYNKSNGLTLYPNPSNGMVTVGLKDVNQPSYLLEIFDIQGNLVKQLNVNGSDLSSELKVQIESGKGTYILRLNNSNELSKTLIIE